MRFLHTLVRGKPTGVHVELFRYVLVAFVGLVFDIGGLVLLKEVLHVNYLLAATISFCGAVIINYALSSLWIFESKRHKAIEFSLFLLVGVGGLGLNDLFLWLLVSKLGMFYLYAKLIATGIVFFWNFLGRKALLFL
jgi:putative flippase GtrA